MRTKFCALIVAAAIAIPGVALAQADDRNGSVEMMSGNYAAAERMLVAERRLFPDHADLTLNLAAVYKRAGKIDQARALYREVLKHADESVALSTKRSYSSHVLARIALERLDGTRLSSR